MAGPYKSLEDLDAALASKEPAQPYKSIGDLDAAITQSDDNDQQRLGFSAKQSLAIQPDKYIKARDLGSQFGIPPDVAERNLPEVEYRNKLDALIGTMRSSPALGTLMQDPGYLKRTHDDIDALAQVEMQTKGFRAASEFTRKALDAEVQAIFDRAWTGAKIEADIERNRERTVFDYVGQGGSALASSLWSANSGLWGLGRAAADVVGTVLPDEAAKEITGFFTRYQQATGKTAQQMLGDPNQQGFVERSIYSGLQSLGQNLLTLPAALIPGVGPGVTLGPMTAMTGGTEYGKARDKGVAVPQALIYGASQAAIEYATEVMPVTKFLGDIKAGTPFAQMLMKQVAYEIPGEQVATLLQDLNEWAVINPSKPFKSYLEERPSAAAQTLIATIVGVGGQTATVKGVETLVGAVTGQDQPFSDPMVRRAQAAQRTLEAEATITQLVDTAGQSLSIARDPSAVQELIDQADEDGQSEVFINARQFANVFNQDPVQTAAALGVDATALNDALSSNTDLVVPLSTFATAVARDQALRPIIEHTRVDPGDMSPSEARLWQSQQGEQFKSEAEAVLNKRAADEAFKAEVQAVHDRVLAELAQAKRFNQQTNEKYAAVVRDFYVTMADRAGMTVSEMAAKYPLRVVAEGTGPLNQNSVRIRRTIDELVDAAESQSDWKTWYARHEDTLIQMFGNDADLFQKILSATSQATGVKGNVSLALKAYDQLLSGQDFTGYLPAVIKNLERIRADQALEGAKISQYGKANEGDTDAIAVDRHIAMLFFNTKSPTAKQIEVAKQRIRKVAAKLGWEPRQVQAALWAFNQVRLGTNPTQVESYDNFLEARADFIAALRSKHGRGEGGSVPAGGGIVPRGQDGSRAGSAGAVFNQSEQQRDLIVQHNLTAENLLHAVRMGGIPVPSLAITKKDTPLTGFGEITLLGSKDMADPKGYAGTKVFGADIYSPRYPSVEYQFTANMQKRAEAMLKDGIEATGNRIDWDEWQRRGVDGAKRTVPLMWKFLKERGVEPTIVRKEAKPLPPALQPFANDNRFTHELAADPAFIEAAWQAHTDMLVNAYDGDVAAAQAEVAQDRARAEDRGASQLVRSYASQVNQYRMDSAANGAVDARSTGYEIEAQIRNEGMLDKFEDYAREFFAGINPNERIFQGYTNNGRRYVAHTLENVVKILKKELRGGEGFNYGVGSIRSAFTPQFKSIKQIREAKDRLMDKAAFEAVKDEIDKEFFALSDKLRSFHPVGKDFGFGDTVSSMMYDAGRMGVPRALKENGFNEVPAEDQRDIAEFLGKLRDLPTEYFEAKILRDVDLTEFSGAVVPEGVTPKVIEALNARGIKDIRYYKKGDDADRRAKIGEFENLFFQNPDVPRGSFNPDTNTIALLEGADLSTFLHESGHFFLEVMADLASRPDAPAAIRKDFETTLAWFGIEASPELDAVATWNLMTLEEKRQYHEQWARGFEAYLFEGKAPSVELQGIFQRFRAWMIHVYESLKALNVELTDEVRGVFDRMLASEDAIKTAEAVRNFAPIFQTAEQAGMTAEEWGQYQDEGKQATADAVDEVQTRSIRDMRWLANAKARKIRELQAAAKEVRAQVRMDVRREVLNEPLYRAWQFLTGKNPDQIAKAKAQKSNPNEVDPTKDTLLIAIAKLGGLDKLQAVEEWGLDPKEKIPQVAFGKPVVRKDGGRKLDAMAEALAQYGYLEVDPTGKWDNRQLEEMFFDALRGGEYFSQYGEEAMIAAATREAQGDPDAGVTLENTPTGKLNTEMLKGMYGTADTAPWRFLSALRMTSADGLAPDQVADLFGFTSGDELVRRLAVAEDPKIVIDARTDQRMLEEFGDLATPGDIERAAERAIHNEVRARMLTRELNALRKAVGRGNVVLKAARQHAEAWLARQTVRNAIKHAQHVAAEGRSARAAETALKAGDTEAAAIHKRDQLLNNQIARGALRAADEVRIAIKYLKKFEKEGTRKAIDPEYRDQIDQLLERFDLRQVSGKTLEKRASLAAWLKAQEEQGLDPVIDAALVEEAQRQHYSTLTLEEFRGLVDSIKSIEHLGRLKNHLLTAKDKRAFDAVKAELSGSIARNANRDVKTANAITPLEKGAKLLRSFAAMHRKFASIVREMDGGKDGGPMWEYLVRTMNEAGDREVTLRGEMSEKFADLFDGIKGIKLNEKVFVQDLNISLRREELLAIALNSGNDGNVQRLLDGGINESLQAITGRQLMGVLNQITDKEWDFVEGVWAMIEENRPAIAAQEKALTGVEPKWVDPTPFTLASGRVIRGGYYPAKYNADMSTRSNELEAVTDLRQQMQGAAGRAATRKSYTEQRSKEVTGRPLRLDLGVISQHINEVTHRLSWQAWLIDARRILNAPEIDRAIRDHYGPEILAQMKKQLADIAAGDNGPTDALDKVMNHIRNGTTIAGMGWNIMTSLMQPIGLTQSVERVGATWIAKGLGQYLSGNPFKVTADVHERSEFMANRAKTINREINDVLNRIRADKMSRVEASYFYLIQKFQQMVDVPTWLGAYEKAIAEGNAEDRAVALADQAVIDSQGGGQLKDRSAIQRGGPGQKLFTNFYSFFNTTYNRAVENARATDFSNPMQVGKLAANYLLLFSLPAVWGWALKEALRGDDDDEDAKKIAKRLAMEQINYLLGTMVLVREIGSAISGFSGYQGPAGTRFFAELGKLIKQTEQGDVDMALVKAAANTVGIAAHLPSGQIMKSVEGTVAVMDGKAGPQAVLVGPPIKN